MAALLAVIIAGAIAVFMFGFLVAASFNVGWGLSIGESASLFVASAAFFISTYQTYTTRLHNRLTVKPKISINVSLSTENSPSVGFFVKNSGTGPAVIESIELIKGNESGLLTDGSFKKIVPNWANQQFKFTALPMGYPILSNDGVWIVETSSSNHAVFDSELDGLTIKVKYKSIYDEVFSGSLSVN